MAYDTPTIADFRAKFPNLVDTNGEVLEDVYIDGLIVEANRSVDDTWTDGDYAVAILYLAAHYHELTLLADAETAGAVEGAPAGQVISSEHIGPISVSYGKSTSASGSGGSATTSEFAMTVNGQRYRDLLIKNIPAVLVI